MGYFVRGTAAALFVGVAAVVVYQDHASKRRGMSQLTRIIHVTGWDTAGQQQQQQHQQGTSSTSRNESGKTPSSSNTAAATTTSSAFSSTEFVDVPMQGSGPDPVLASLSSIAFGETLGAMEPPPEAAPGVKEKPSVLLMRNISRLIPTHNITELLRQARPTFFKPRPLAAEAKDVARRLRLVDSGPGWALLCSRGPTILVAVQGSMPSHPRCVVYREKCSEPGGFKMYLYPKVLTSPGGEKPSILFNGVYKALESGDAPFGSRITHSVSEACVFMPGLDILLFGNAPGMLGHVNGTELLLNHTEHALAPQAGWLGGPGVDAGKVASAKPPVNRKLWGLNHLSLSLCDWNIDEERSYQVGGTLPVRTTTPNVTYQNWIDVQVPAPKVVKNQRNTLVAGSERPGLMFFAGSVYNFKSSRYQMRHLRDFGSDEEFRIWLYCYDKTKKGRSRRRGGGKWDIMKRVCAPETNRAGEAGLFPAFKKRQKKKKHNFMPPQVHSGENADLFAWEMQGSTFCLIARGWALHNYRLTESMYFGCIPVWFIPGALTGQRGDKTHMARVPIEMSLPFQETLNWRKLLVFMDEDLLYTESGRQEIVDYLRGIKRNATLVNEMQVQAVLAHDLFQGGGEPNASMYRMMESTLNEYEHRMRVYGHALKHHRDRLEEV